MARADKPDKPIQYRVSKKEYLDAIENSKGSLSVIADAVGQSRSTVASRIRNDPELAGAYSHEYEEVLGLTEDRLFEAIDRGEPWAIKLFLTTRGSAKGYGLRQEITTNMPVIVLNWTEGEARRPDIQVIEAQSVAKLPASTDPD